MSDGVQPDVGIANPLPFPPANIPIEDLDFTGTNDIELTAGACLVDTDALTITCGGSPISQVYKTQLVGTVDGGTAALAVFMATSFKVDFGVTVTVTGSHAIALVAKNGLAIDGAVTVNPNGSGSGTGASDSAPCIPTGDADPRSPGGGSFCGTGGAPVPTGAGAAPAYGSPTLVPLLAGSSGGAACSTTLQTLGGGAIELVAGGAASIGSGGGINVPGGAGGSATQADANGAGGGGGSGGAILIQATTVEVGGFLTANGGAGGEAEEGPGAVGHPNATAACQGILCGSAGPTINGSNAINDTTDNGCEGGAGGAGRIRLDSQIGTATLNGTAVISPSITTTCFSQGTL